jgi:hypothetical protein
MRNALRNLIGGMAAAALTLAFATAGAQAASSPSTPVHLSSAQVAQTLFVAGDVGRLSQIPSGTESVVEEKVLQQLYADNPLLAPGQAVSDIQGLQAALASGAQAISPATLTVMAGNERILAILRDLSHSNPASDVLHAIAQVTGQALTASSQSTQFLGQAFDASADSLDTLSYTAFSPAGVLATTWTEASTNALFGQARDTLWKQASSESVFDSTHTLLSENPALQNAAVNSFVNMLNADGTLDTTVGGLESLIDNGIQQISDQNCTLASGTSGASPNDCASGALHDAQLVAQNCPNGPNDTSSNCQAARSQAAGDQPGEIGTINAYQAATAAEANALGGTDTTLSLANAADAEAAAQLAQQENAYLNYQSLQQAEKAGFDVATLAVSLGAAEIDPVAAVGALLNVVGDAVGFGFGGPDPNTLILQGIQNITQQLSDFEQYTESAFQTVDTQLSNISGQVSQIAALITNAQQQLTQLATQVANLQSSVDHLQSEVQSLFAQGARNDLGTLINQYIGFQQANGTPLPQTQFAQAAGALYQDATSTALTQTLLTVPTGFDALNAQSLITGTDPLTLDTNINLFNFFGSNVTDSFGVSWPGALSTTCPPNANLAQSLCLPDPDFWATSARAFAQLLLENPSYVTPTRITQLNAIDQEGQLIANALQQLSANNAGADAGGTGNKTLDAAVNYFRYWGDANNHPGGTPPSLWQAIKNDEQFYLSEQSPGISPPPQYGDVGVDPWGGLNQSPDLATLDTLTSFNNVPLCPGIGGVYGLGPNDDELPSLPQSLIAWLNPVFLNAARLGIGTISPCWNVGAANITGNNFDLSVAINYYYSSADGKDVRELIGRAAVTDTGAYDCAGQPDPQNPFTPDVPNTVYKGWEGQQANCPDLSVLLSQAQNQTQMFPIPGTADAANGVDAELLSLRRGFYNQLLGSGGLTVGKDQNSDVLHAADRLDGADDLLKGYVSLGLPQALASDDTLQSLVSGAYSVTLEPPNGRVPGAVPGSNIPNQVINLYKAELNNDTDPSVGSPVKDPADVIAGLVDQRATALDTALAAHIVAAAGQSGTLQGRVQLSSGIAAAQTSSTVFAEENPYLGPTLDRLDETALVLNDEMNGSTTATGTPAAPATPGATTTTTTTPTTATVTATSAKCTLRAVGNKVLLAARKGKAANGAPKPGTLSLTVTCNRAGKVKLTGTLTQLIGAKPKHRKQKSKTYKLGPVSGTVKAGKGLTLTVKLPAAAVTALGGGAQESATFTAVLTGPGATGRASAKIAALKGTR